MVATAVFVNVRKNLGADGRGIVAVADKKDYISSSFFFLFSCHSLPPFGGGNRSRQINKRGKEIKREME